MRKRIQNILRETVFDSDRIKYTEKERSIESIVEDMEFSIPFKIGGEIVISSMDEIMEMIRNSSYEDEQESAYMIIKGLMEAKRIQEDGGILYRILFLSSPDRIKKNQLGLSWTYHPNLYQDLGEWYGKGNEKDFLGDSPFEGSPYLVTVKAPAGCLAIQASKNALSSNPVEQELCLKPISQDKLTILKIEELETS